ncbi:hypothetical protein NEOLEDRAFT_1179169 [Neolentinus lepideus HHB14362 ss-1]|uniref:BHLH domain-containing protein n=1 Tax=Neolentinus lepideus HHB14362 ss-1 TaxID=1314782 RepID=A0A165RZW7_9AGAM|nr:hypothetical protein NEOLEDRAFT_1179169 [Neolentinus lepideus HHB14362 ss-1]
MVENKRKAGGKGSKAKAVYHSLRWVACGELTFASRHVLQVGGNSQKTLLHHFQRKAPSILSAKVENASATQTPGDSGQGSQVSDDSTLSTSLNAEHKVVADTEDEMRNPDTAQTNSPSSTVPPRQPFPIFLKPVSHQAFQEDTTLMLDPSEPHLSLPVMDITKEDSPHATSVSIADTPPSSSLRMESPEVIAIGNGCSREDPIVIEQSPIQSRQEPPSSKVVFPIFAHRSRDSRLTTPASSAPRPEAVFPIFAAQKAVGSPVSRSLSNRTKESEAPLPDADQQHIRGEQTSFHAPELRFGIRHKGKGQPISEGQSGPLSAPNISVSEADPRSPLSRCGVGYRPVSHAEDFKLLLDSIPKSHRSNYPAISRIIKYLELDDRDDLCSPSQLWTERWRPKRADEVLGNEVNTLYLRNWLEALALQAESNSTTESIDSPTGKKRKSRTKTKKSKNERKAKKPKIQRAVEKPKGRGRRRDDSDIEDDWIVDTEDETESEPDILPGSEDDLEFCRQTLSRLHHKSDVSEPMDLHVEAEPDGSEPGDDSPSICHSTPDFSNRLTNTILLAGSSGCGKTAAVYACAEELGWEVFEVYPGIGKRSNTNLDSLVGDVGKNHTLRKGVFRKSAGLFTKHDERRPQAGSTSADTEERSSRNQENLPASEVNVACSHPRDEVNASFVPPAAHEGSKIRQSLVLLEEVDVLYKDDQNFWPAVINFIKGCRRPVVMTCNDVSLVPLQDLPLQEVLTFAPAPPTIAASYLQSLCFAEGFRIDRQILTELYESPQGRDTGAPPGSADWSQNEDIQVMPDLRSAINQLQFFFSAKGALQEPWSEGIGEPRAFADPDIHVAISRERSSSTSDAVDDGPANSSDAKAQLELLKGLAHHAEMASFLDSDLGRKAWQTPQALLERECRSSVNDETGYQILFPGSTASELEVSALYHRDEEMRQGIESRVRYPLTPGAWLPFVSDRSRARGRQSFDTRSLFRARNAHVSHVVAVLRSILPFSCAFKSTAPIPQVFLDYLPWVRRMVATDEEEERRESQTAKAGRRTRNSLRYVRYISLTEEQQNTLRSTSPRRRPRRRRRRRQRPQHCAMPPSPAAGSHTDDKPPANPDPVAADNSHKKPLSPETLAPLEYLQNQRRGSITDPSLHRASPHLQPSVPPARQNSSADPPSPSTKSRNNSKEPRPTSPYTFGDVSVNRRPEGSQPVNETSWRQPMSAQSDSSAPEGSSRPQESTDMDVDQGERQLSPTGNGTGQGNLGTKRKMSSDREAASEGAEIDPQLVGPGMNVDAEGPATKRRGSAFDTQRIAQLSLNDRRYSVDSRLPGVPGEQAQWWAGDRRDSAPGVFANNVGYGPPSGFAADPHGRPPGGMATFAWPATTHPPEQPVSATAPNPSASNPNNIPGPQRPFDPSAPPPPPPLSMNYTVTFASDRRMSVPDMPGTSPGPTTQRVLRSRSRPPSRTRTTDQSAGSQGQSPTSSTEQQPDSATSTPTTANKKDSTPYSRSPELRVSHKLAERKRRKEMKDLFDELRDQLPADRGMKASKWEILSKGNPLPTPTRATSNVLALAIDFIVQLKHGHQEMAREIEMLRHEVDGMRSGMPPFAGGPPPMAYAQGPPPPTMAHNHYAAPPVPHPPHPTHPPQQPPQPASRPGSSQNVYPPGGAPPGPPQQNGHVNGPGAKAAETAA